MESIAVGMWRSMNEPFNPNLGVRAGGQGKGERNFAGNAAGTKNPFKHMKPDPKNPNNVLVKNPQTGKTVSKSAPEGFEEYWKNISKR